MMKKKLRRMPVLRKAAKPGGELALNWSRFALEAVKWLFVLHGAHVL